MANQLVDHAIKLLRANPAYLDDAREGAPLGNSVVGSVMSITLHAPRQHTEAAVCEAVRLLDNEGETMTREWKDGDCYKRLNPTWSVSTVDSEGRETRDEGIEDFVIYGRVEHSPYPEDKAVEEAMKQRGYYPVYAWSDACLRGEPGTEHTDYMIPISEDEFNEALRSIGAKPKEV